MSDQVSVNDNDSFFNKQQNEAEQGPLRLYKQSQSHTGLLQVKEMITLVTNQQELTNHAKRETSYFTSADFRNDSLEPIEGLEVSDQKDGNSIPAIE